MNFAIRTLEILHVRRRPQSGVTVCQTKFAGAVLGFVRDGSYVSPITTCGLCPLHQMLHEGGPRQLRSNIPASSKRSPRRRMIPNGDSPNWPSSSSCLARIIRYRRPITNGSSLSPQRVQNRAPASSPCKISFKSTFAASIVRHCLPRTPWSESHRVSSVVYGAGFATTFAFRGRGRTSTRIKPHPYISCHETAPGNHARVTRLCSGPYRYAARNAWRPCPTRDGEPLPCGKTLRRVRLNAGPLKLKPCRIKHFRTSWMKNITAPLTATVQSWLTDRGQ